MQEQMRILIWMPRLVWLTAAARAENAGKSGPAKGVSLCEENAGTEACGKRGWSACENVQVCGLKISNEGLPGQLGRGRKYDCLGLWQQKHWGDLELNVHFGVWQQKRFQKEAVQFCVNANSP
jgi:hypothetical protein